MPPKTKQQSTIFCSPYRGYKGMSLNKTNKQ
jgi:hypothetical protein